MVVASGEWRVAGPCLVDFPCSPCLYSPLATLRVHSLPVRPDLNAMFLQKIEATAGDPGRGLDERWSS